MKRRRMPASSFRSRLVAFLALSLTMLVSGRRSYARVFRQQVVRSETAAVLSEVQLAEKAWRMAVTALRRPAAARAWRSPARWSANRASWRWTLHRFFGALYALTRISMQELLNRVWRNSGFTAVLASPMPCSAKLVHLADRVVVLDEGADRARSRRSLSASSLATAIRRRKPNSKVSCWRRSSVSARHPPPRWRQPRRRARPRSTFSDGRKRRTVARSGGSIGSTVGATASGRLISAARASARRYSRVEVGSGADVLLADARRRRRGGDDHARYAADALRRHDGRRALPTMPLWPRAAVRTRPQAARSRWPQAVRGAGSGVRPGGAGGVRALQPSPGRARVIAPPASAGVAAIG